MGHVRGSGLNATASGKEKKKGSKMNKFYYFENNIYKNWEKGKT